MSGLIRSIGDVDTFVHAGNATLTVENEQSGNRFTFKVSAPKDRDTGKRDYDADRIFVSLLSGPNNEADYTYVGMIESRKNPHAVVLTKGSRVGPDAPSFRAINYVLDHARKGKELPPVVHVYHEGKCGRCGRKLTVPESIERGIGPECAQHML